MIRRLPLPLALLLATGACGKAPEPTADPNQLAIVLAQLEARDSPRELRFQRKIAGADRVSGTLSRVEPERLDPNIAVVLLR